MRLRLHLLLGLSVLGTLGAVHAAPAPEYINYQGVLRGSTGAPLDGEYDVVFRIFDAQLGGDLLLTDSHGAPEGVQVTDGLFNTHVGGGDLTPGQYSTLSELVAAESEVWLEVSIWNPDATTWEVLSPRVRIVSAAYALSASSADGAFGDFDVAGDVQVGGTTESAGGFRFPDGSVQTSSALRDVCTELTGAPVCDIEQAVHGVAWAGLATVLDSGQYLGKRSSLAIGADGAPVISYEDPLNDALKVAKCANPQCTSAVVSTVDTDHPWTGNSIAIGDDGLPVISYSYKVAKCVDPACTSATVNTLPGTPQAGGVTLAVGDDGNPVIAFTNAHSGPAAPLMVAVCADPACASATVSTVASGALASDPSLTIGADGNPIFSFYEVTGTSPDLVYTLAVQQCLDPACTILGPVQPLDPTAGDHSSHVAHTAITIGADGHPVIAYLADGVSGHDLRVAKCTDSGCSAAGAVISTPDPYGNSGYYASIVIGTDGNPLISYSGGSVSLSLAWCSNPACTEGTRQSWFAVSDSTSYPSWERWVAIGADGRPVVAYHDTKDVLRVVTGIVRTDNAGPWGDSSVTADAAALVPASPETIATDFHGDPAEIPRSLVRSENQLRTGQADRMGGRSARCVESPLPDAESLTTVESITESVEEGEVLVLDIERSGKLSLSRLASDPAVFGVVTSPRTDHPVPDVAERNDLVSVVVSGVAVCRVDAGYGAIRPGDLLTTSATPGHAMLAYDPRPGTILGKALEPLGSGTGLIKVLVMLR